MGNWYSPKPKQLIEDDEMNCITLVGNLGRDPDTKTVNDKTLTKFSIATGSKEYTEWHDIECWGQTADIAARYLKKGSTVAIRGEMRSNTVEKDGKKTKYWKCVADRIKLIGGNKEKTDESSRLSDYKLPEPINLDEIPF